MCPYLPQTQSTPSLALSRPSAQTSTSPLVHHHLSIFPLLDSNFYLPIIGELVVVTVSKTSINSEEPVKSVTIHSAWGRNAQASKKLGDGAGLSAKWLRLESIWILNSLQRRCTMCPSQIPEVGLNNGSLEERSQCLLKKLDQCPLTSKGAEAEFEFRTNLTFHQLCEMGFPLKCRKPGLWFLDRQSPLEKGTATYSSNLAWEIPWTEKPMG